jgi:hypothetical protein
LYPSKILGGAKMRLHIGPKRWKKSIIGVSIAEENRAKEVKEVDTSLPTSRWKEAQIEPTPIRCRELCYSCKVPWEPDHRCTGVKGRVHYIEVHYDSDDEESDEDEALDASLEQSLETLAHFLDSWMDRMIVHVL